MRLLVVLTAAVLVTPLMGAEPQAEAPELEPAILTERPAPPTEGQVLIPIGTRVPLVLLNSVSTKHANPDDLVYLESMYPVVVNGKIVIPPGTYVSGRVTSLKRPGRVKGKGELYVRFEQMILPNGVIRDLVGRIGALDGRAPEGFDREEGKVSSEGSKGQDARTVGEAAAAGASVGVIAGAIGDPLGPVVGAAAGAAVGATAGLIGVLISRGPDAILEQGTQLDMVLVQGMVFREEELEFDDPLGVGRNREAGRGPDPNRNHSGTGSGRFSL